MVGTISDAERNWILHRVREVDCYRYDAEDGTLRSVTVDVRRLYTAREAVRYLELAYGIETSVGVIREAVFVGDLDCHFLKTPALVRRGRPIRLARAALRFTKLQLQRSDWLYIEQSIRRVELEQGVLAARRMHDLLRHPGRPPARYDSTPAAIAAGAERMH